MDLQYAPIVLAASNHRVMQAIIAEVARAETGRPVFTLHIDAPLDRGRAARRRTRLLGRTAQLTASYDCVGRALARAVHAGAR